MKPRGAELRGMTALILGAVCIGFAPLWVRWSETGPVATAFHRLWLALPAMALWANRDRRKMGPPGGRDRTDYRWVVAAGVFFAIDLGAWHLSIRFTTVANATLLANFAPVFVTLGAWLFLGERASSRFFSGMALALAGAFLLTGATFAADPARLKGDALGLATALFYGGYQLCVARLRRRHSTGFVIFGASLAATPLLWLFAFALDERLLPTGMRGWLVLIGLAITAQVLGQGLITYGFAHLPAGYSSLTLLVQPVVAAAAAWALLGEAMTVRQGLGGAVLLSGLILARRTPGADPEGGSRSGWWSSSRHDKPARGAGE